jgi:hypothetical protein
MYTTPPAIPTTRTPQDILGYNYDLFIEMVDWVRNNLGGDPERFQKSFGSKYNTADREWYRDKLTELHDHGFFYIEFNGKKQWCIRMANETDKLFDSYDIVEKTKENPALQQFIDKVTNKN